MTEAKIPQSGKTDFPLGTPKEAAASPSAAGAPVRTGSLVAAMPEAKPLKSISDSYEALPQWKLEQYKIAYDAFFPEGNA